MSLFASNFLLSFCFALNLTAQEPDIAKGKSLFNANCASCHKLNKKLNYEHKIILLENFTSSAIHKYISIIGTSQKLAISAIN